MKMSIYVQKNDILIFLLLGPKLRFFFQGAQLQLLKLLKDVRNRNQYILNLREPQESSKGGGGGCIWAPSSS